MKIISFALVLTPYLQAASPEEPTGGLLLPAVNLLILALLLRGKVTHSLATHFGEEKKRVEEMYDYAEKKNREAQIRLGIYQKKMAHLHGEMEGIKEEGLEQLKRMEEEGLREEEAAMVSMEEQWRERMVQEKNKLLGALRREVVEKIIEDIREKTRGDSALRRRITRTLMGKITGEAIR